MAKEDIFRTLDAWTEDTLAMLKEEAEFELSERLNREHNPDLQEGMDYMELYG